MIKLTKRQIDLRELLPERKTELLLALYLPAYLAFFFLVERLVPNRGYWVSYLPLDDRIPFWPPAILGYLLWFPFQLVTGLYLFVREPRAYRRMMTFFIIGYTAINIFYLLFPNGQDLRADLTGMTGVFVEIIRFLYSIDTNTNVMPSLHVVGAWMAMNAWFDAPSLRRGRFWAVLAVVVISASTVLVKQHSILDVYTGVACSVLLTLLVYRKRIGGLLRAEKKGES